MVEHYPQDDGAKLAQFKIESDNSPGHWYVVTEYADGRWACGCLGWTRHVPRRDCKHIRWAKSGVGVAFDPLLRAVEVAQRKAERRAR